MTETQKGNRRALRYVVVLLAASVVIAVVALMLIAHYRPAIELWIDEDPPARLQTLALLAALSMLPLAAAATYVFRLGHRIVRAERFPPPGTTVLRDTVVLRGRAARRRGRLLQGLAVVLIAATTVGIGLLLRLVSEVDAR